MDRKFTPSYYIIVTLHSFSILTLKLKPIVLIYVAYGVGMEIMSAFTGEDNFLLLGLVGGTAVFLSATLIVSTLLATFFFTQKRPELTIDRASDKKQVSEEIVSQLGLKW